MTLNFNSYGFGEAAVKQKDSCNLILDHPCFTAEQPSIEESSFYTEFCTWVSSREDARVYKNILSPFVMHWIFSIDLLFNQNFT